jgi:uncharacterized damage-inducible protein DinB
MYRYTTLIAAAAFLTAGAIQAQTLKDHIAEAKGVWTGVSGNFVRDAEAMPEENYSFKPTSDIRSYGEVVAHIADTQASICSAVSGTAKKVDAASKTSKADLLTALKDSIAHCNAAWDGITDANAFDQLQLMGKRSKLGALEFNSVHTEDELGYGAVYLRLKGVVPPQSQPRGGRGR